MKDLRHLYVAKNIRASRVNLLMNDFAAGLPSPLSILGLADLLMRRMGLNPWTGQALAILHQVHVSEGRTKPEMDLKNGSFAPIETIEDLTGTVDLSLLLHLPGCGSDGDLKRALQGCRIAGGLIQNDEIQVERVTPDGSAFRGLHRGYAMIRPDRPERLLTSRGREAEMSAVAATLFPAERPQGFGWIVPVAVGYRLLEDPETAPQRIRTRCREVPHVFAEPLLGIAELVSIRNPRITELTEEALGALLWSWDARGDHVLGHPDYHTSHSPKETSTHG